MSKKIAVDFRQVCNLGDKVVGYVAKIISPKGIREYHEQGDYYSYMLDTTIAAAGSSEKEVMVDPGLYEVLNITRWAGSDLQWNIYLVQVNASGEAFPVAEWLDNPHTQWVKEARPIVKDYFDDVELEPIELTPKPEKREVKPNFMNKPVTPSNTKKSEESKKSDTKKSENKGAQTSTQSKKDAPAKSSDSKKDTSEKKKSTGRPQETRPLNYGEARLMTFTGMVIGIYPVTRHNSKNVEVETAKGKCKFSKDTGKQVDAENPRYANKIEFNLEKED
jgi:hypothetical protein